MTKHLLLTGIAALILAAFTSCSSDATTDDTKTITGDSTAVDPGTFDFDTLKGMYTGDFGQSNLKLIISYASEAHATGYNIVKGVQRNISGKVTLQPETVEMELSEPGDDKNDGVFHISVDRKTLLMTGTWKPNNPKGKEKTFVLDRIVLSKGDKELTADNFARLFFHVGDSLGDLYFEDNGSCRYEYYTKNGEVTRSRTYWGNMEGGAQIDLGQLQEISGSWTYRNSKVIIEWEENPVFPSRKSTFAASLDPETFENALRGDGRELGGYMYY
jgi:hypothetical protein